MRETQQIMNMPVTVEIVDQTATADDLAAVFAWFHEVDEQFSPFKASSEVSQLNRGQVDPSRFSRDGKFIWTEGKVTRRQTGGFFDTFASGRYDPSGLVKGWAIQQASERLRAAGFVNTYVEVGGDIQVSGRPADGEQWRIGIRHPVQHEALAFVVALTGQGIATSGAYERGNHIFDPRTGQAVASDIISLTVIGLNVYDADRFATAAFAMGPAGIRFIERLPGLEGCAIDRHGQATLTGGFDHYQVL